MRYFILFSGILIALGMGAWEAFQMHADSVLAGMAIGLAILLVGVLSGVFIGIKLEDKYDIDSGGRNYRRAKKNG